MANGDFEEDRGERPEPAPDAKAARLARRAALRQAAKSQQSSMREWEGSRYAKALAEGSRRAECIAQKRRSGIDRAGDDWIDKSDEAVLAFLSKVGEQAKECLVEAHLDAAYAATKGWRGIYRSYGLDESYSENVRRAIEAAIKTFDPSAGTLNAWVSLNAKKPLGEWFYQWYADRTALATKHEAHQYHEIIQAYRKLDAILAGIRRPTEEELLAALAEKTITKGISREALRDILDRGSDGRCEVALASLPAPANPASPIAFDAFAVAPSPTEAPAPDALAFRNRLESDMTFVERAVYEARIAPVVDGGAAPMPLGKTARALRESFGLALYADRVRRIELRLRRRFVVGGEAGVYAGSPETSTWLSSKNSSLHSEYWLLDLLALRLAEIQPRAKRKAKGAKPSEGGKAPVGVSRDSCYSALVPFDIATDDLSGNSSAGLVRPLWEISKLARPKDEPAKPSASGPGVSGVLGRYERYCANPLEFVKGQPAGRVLADEGMLWHFFFDEGTPEEVREFCDELASALEHDSAAVGKRAYGESEARAYVVEKLLRAAMRRGDGCSSYLERALSLMLSWMFGLALADDESAALARDGLVTGGGARAGESAESGEGHSEPSPVLAFDASLMANGERTYLEAGGIVRVHPWMRPRIGIGHLFEKDALRSVGGRRDEFAGVDAWGVIDLPGQKEGPLEPGCAFGRQARAQDPISREHALFEYGAGTGWKVFDMASSNGTLVVKPDPKGSGSCSYVVAGFGANNYADVRSMAFAAGCETDERALFEVARRTGASVATKAGISWYEKGVPVRPGDMIVLGFCVVEQPDGTIAFAERNGSCRIRVREN